MSIFLVFDVILLLLLIGVTGLFLFRKYRKKPAALISPPDKTVFKSPTVEYVENPHPHQFPVVAGTNPELAIENHPNDNYVQGKRRQKDTVKPPSDDIALRSILPFEQGGLNMHNNSSNM